MAAVYLLRQRHRQKFLVLASVTGTACCAAWVATKELSPIFFDTSRGLLFNVSVAAHLFGCFAAGSATYLFWPRINVTLVPVIPMWAAMLVEHHAFGTTLLVTPNLPVSITA